MSNCSFRYKVVAHIQPQERVSWDKHGIIGYYVGPALEHYRCYKVYWLWPVPARFFERLQGQDPRLPLGQRTGYRANTFRVQRERHIPTTKGIRISDCIEWFPADILTSTIDKKSTVLPLLPLSVDNDT